MPDVIVGCESHHDVSFTLAETFPKGFQVYRKDRSMGGGSIFLAVKDTLAVTEVTTLDVDAELIWIKIKLKINHLYTFALIIDLQTLS